MGDFDDDWPSRETRRQQVERLLAGSRLRVEQPEHPAVTERKARERAEAIKAHDEFFGLIGRSDDEIAKSLQLPRLGIERPRLYSDDDSRQR